jgi:hypothetical protein
MGLTNTVHYCPNISLNGTHIQMTSTIQIHIQAISKTKMFQFFCTCLLKNITNTTVWRHCTQQSQILLKIYSVVKSYSLKTQTAVLCMSSHSVLHHSVAIRKSHFSMTAVIRDITHNDIHHKFCKVNTIQTRVNFHCNTRKTKLYLIIIN